MGATLARVEPTCQRIKRAGGASQISVSVETFAELGAVPNRRTSEGGNAASKIGRSQDRPGTTGCRPCSDCAGPPFGPELNQSGQAPPGFPRNGGTACARCETARDSRCRLTLRKNDGPALQASVASTVSDWQRLGGRHATDHRPQTVLKVCLAGQEM